ncbi:hypothetical protein [Escherichia coli]
MTYMKLTAAKRIVFLYLFVIQFWKNAVMLPTY